MVWRLIRDGDHAAAWNMAADEAILDAVVADIASPTLRLYGWTETAITMGRFQNVERDVDMDFCAARGIPIVRRPTGGRGILHGGDVTVSVAIPISLLGTQGWSVSAGFQRLSAGLLVAFKSLGLPLDHGKCARAASRSGDCFQTSSASDLVTTDGAKLIGSAMRRSRSVVLMQSSVRHRRSSVAAASVFRGKVGDEYYPLDHLDAEEIEDAIEDGFATALNLTLQPGGLTAWEEERAAALLKTVTVAENTGVTTRGK